MARKRAFRAPSGPHTDKNASHPSQSHFLVSPECLPPLGVVFIANRTDVPFSLPTSSPCFLRFLVPSLRVLPVSWDSLYPRLYQSKAFPLFRCNMLDGVHFLPQIPGEIALRFGSSRESGRTDVGTRTGGDQTDLTFPKSVYVREKKDPKEDG